MKSGALPPLCCFNDKKYMYNDIKFEQTNGQLFNAKNICLLAVLKSHMVSHLKCIIQLNVLVSPVKSDPLFVPFTEEFEYLFC